MRDIPSPKDSRKGPTKSPKYAEVFIMVQLLNPNPSNH